MIKITLVLVVCAIYVVDCKVKKTTLFLAPELTAQVNKAVLGCKQELDNVLEFLKIIHDGEYKKDERFGQFVYCLGSKMGFVNKNGKFIVGNSAALFPEKEKMIKLFEKCNEQSGPTPQATCNLAFECFQKESPYKVSFANH